MGNSSTLSSVQFVLREFSISLAWSGTWQPHTLTIGLSVVHCVKRRLNERMYWHNICLMCIKYGEEKQQCSCMNWTNFAFPIYCMNYMVVFWVWVKIDLKRWTFFYLDMGIWLLTYFVTWSNLQINPDISPKYKVLKRCFFSLGEPLQSGKFDSFGDADLRCPVCGKLFHNRSNMRRHMFDVHSDIKRFRCTLCDQAFKRKSALRQHLKSVHWQADK